MIIRPDLARRSHVDGGRKRAAVCSFPPSEVGVGITTSDSSPSGSASSLVDDAEGRSCDLEERGSM